MPHNPELVEETREWLLKVRDDLEAAERLLSLGRPLPGHAAFNAQQAAEKAEKAFLTWHGRPFLKTHDLAILGQDCTAIDPSLSAPAVAANPISRYAVEPRYPGFDPPTVAEAKEAIALARSMYDAVLARLPEEVKP
jgi:HEPN domain-containing protein